jgi:hypothetical protein
MVSEMFELDVMDCLLMPIIAGRMWSLFCCGQDELTAASLTCTPDASHFSSQGAGAWRHNQTNAAFLVWSSVSLKSF